MPSDKFKSDNPRQNATFLYVDEASDGTASLRTSFGDTVYLNQESLILLRHTIDYAIEALEPEPIEVKVGDTFMHSKGYSWRVWVLGIYDDIAWCKHSDAKKPGEYSVAEIERQINNGSWVIA